MCILILHYLFWDHLKKIPTHSLYFNFPMITGKAVSGTTRSSNMGLTPGSQLTTVCSSIKQIILEPWFVIKVMATTPAQPGFTLIPHHSCWIIGVSWVGWFCCWGVSDFGSYVWALSLIVLLTIGGSAKKVVLIAKSDWVLCSHSTTPIITPQLP